MHLQLCLTILKDAPYIIVCCLIVLWYGYQTVRGAMQLLRVVARRRRGFVDIGPNADSLVGQRDRFSSRCHDYQIAKVKSLLKKYVCMLMCSFPVTLTVMYTTLMLCI